MSSSRTSNVKSIHISAAVMRTAHIVRTDFSWRVLHTVNAIIVIVDTARNVTTIGGCNETRMKAERQKHVHCEHGPT